MKKQVRIVCASLAAVLAAVLLGGCSQEDIQKLAQAVNDAKASAANASPYSIEEMRGSVEEQTYINTAAGITVTFPDDYTVLGYEEIKDQYQEDGSVLKFRIV